MVQPNQWIGLICPSAACFAFFFRLCFSLMNIFPAQENSVFKSKANAASVSSSLENILLQNKYILLTFVLFAGFILLAGDIQFTNGFKKTISLSYSFVF